MATTLLFIGTTEMLLIAAVILLIFGGRKLPELMRGLGKGVSEFKKGINDIDTDNKEKKVEKENEPAK